MVSRHVSDMKQLPTCKAKGSSDLCARRYLVCMSSSTSFRLRRQAMLPLKLCSITISGLLLEMAWPFGLPSDSLRFTSSLSKWALIIGNACRDCMCMTSSINTMGDIACTRDTGSTIESGRCLRLQSWVIWESKGTAFDECRSRCRCRSTSTDQSVVIDAMHKGRSAYLFPCSP